MNPFSIMENKFFNEIHLDVGCGRGHFLLQAARQHKRNLYIGIEINRHTHEILEAKLNKSNIPNAHAICAEALDFIGNNVASSSVHGIHVYFPTPYMRPLNQLSTLSKKTESLLLVHNFLAQCRRILVERGTLRIVSDHFSYIRRAKRFAYEVGFQEVPWTSPIKCAEITHIIGTGCEIEMQNNGKEIFALKFL